ncbi:MAG: hypothetical protein MJZ00_06260 [Paludibacteraceae bacterium]|nr:hypothetical protein [Paludibacteraceae bacterium]
MEEEKDEIYRVFEYKDNNPILLLETADKVEAVEFILSNYSRDTLESQSVLVELNIDSNLFWGNKHESVNILINKSISDCLSKLNGFVMPYLNIQNVKIIEFEKKQFNFNRNESVVKKELSIIAKQLNLNTTIFDIPQLGNVYIPIKAINKFLDKSASNKSVDYNTHYSVMYKLLDIIKKAKIVEIHSNYNKNEATEIRSPKEGFTGNLAFIRSYGAIKSSNEKEVLWIKLSLKHILDRKDCVTKNLYSYEIECLEVDKKEKIESAVPHHVEPSTTTQCTYRLNPSMAYDSISLANLLHNVEKSYDKGKEIELRHPIANSSNLAKNQTTHLISSNSISLAKLLLDVKKSYDEEKNILDASKESEKLLIEPGNNILKEYLRQNNFLDRETQEKIVNDKGTHITTNVDTRLDSEIETIKDKLESLHEDQEESNTKSVRKKR